MYYEHLNHDAFSDQILIGMMTYLSADSMRRFQVGYDPDGGMSAAQKAKLLPIVLAMFHTCFNVCNTGDRKSVV